MSAEWKTHNMQDCMIQSIEGGGGGAPSCMQLQLVLQLRLVVKAALREACAQPSTSIKSASFDDQAGRVTCT